MRPATSVPTIPSCIAALFAAACLPLPEVSVQPESDTITSEDGAAVTLKVALTEQPRAAVTVRAVTSKPDEASVSGPVRFDAANWSEPQFIRVTGVDDAQRDGDAAYEITVLASSMYHTAIVAELDFVNRDNDGAQFVGLGDLPGGDYASHVSAVDAAGEVVVGWSRGPSGDEAVRWTAAAGLQSLGGTDSQAHGISADGTWMVGSVAQPSYEQGRGAVLWSADGTLKLIPPPLAGDGIPLFWMIDAPAVQNDGEAFGSCLQRGAYGVPLKCVFPSSGELSVDGGGRILAVDEAGNIAGTNLPDPRHATYVSEAFFGANRLGYPAGSSCATPPPNSCRSEARAFSAGGAVVVGTAQVPFADAPDASEPALADTAFVYTQDETMLALPDLEGGAQASGAYAIDGSGCVIGGFGTDASGQRAVVWVNRSARVLQDVLVEQGATLTGWSLLDIRGISTDGRTFVGNAYNAAGEPEAFWARIPDPL